MNFLQDREISMMPFETAYSRPRVLLLDDDKIYCMLFAKHNAANASCDYVNTPKELYKRLAANSYDLILLDYSLRACSAPEILTEIESLVNTPIVMISSSFANLANCQIAFKHPLVQGYLCKLDAPDHLLDKAMEKLKLAEEKT